ncbi:MAG: ABC transporter ATP-binding protein [Peptoniphilaceae bacterium]|uniref:ABC transporter ATP-binding protein n=1 Tax=Parvimonas sp. TaxID=1944660 RepID=UPI0025D6F229|nr:ABC transporter ATP-binding protein [Parvimonas sp.]MCI5997827.1 ABC transporter ATP-binding protein/permease [Parvimonas sp.]MDD7765365.1 ABC transporter ATP-binding protein [Peptoniphilaceae bacterium]MDY3050203.1 ABC transporter ATP-binding protein [Parvimonas sp.]
MKIVFRLLKKLEVVKTIFIVGIILLIISSLGNVLSPLIIKSTIDNVIAPVTKGAQLDVTLLLVKILTFLFFIILSSVVSYFAIRILMHCANVVAETIRNEAFEVMQSLPVSYFDDKPAGKISSRIVNDAETLRRNFYGTFVSQVFVHMFNVLITYATIFYLNIWLGVLMLVLIPVFVFWQKIYGKKISSMMKSFYESQSEINSQVNEVMNGSTIIQLFEQEDNAKNDFLKTSMKMQEAELSMLKVDSTISWSLVEFFQRLFLFLILSFVTYVFLGGYFVISSGFIFLVIEYTMKIFSSLGMLVRLLPEMGRSLATGERVFELLDAKLESDNDEKIEIIHGNVEFKDVTFSYKEGVQVLKNISFTAKKGETVALVGNTGSGKSSIMNVLFRFYDPQNGEILIDGQNIQNFNRESIRESMGIVLQDPYLFTGTIESNISMGNEKINRAVVIDSLKKVGAMPMIEKLEKGIDTPVVERGNSFSSGERQLISFARTLADDPKILILDEATSHIDTETEDIIQNAMNVVKSGRTTFIIAHRLSTIKNANQILVLENGEIIERGNHQELLKLNGKYAQMYKIQQKI